MNILELNDDCIIEICQHLTDFEFFRLIDTCKDFSYKTKLKKLNDTYDILIIKCFEHQYTFTRCKYLHPYSFQQYNFVPNIIPSTVNHLVINYFPTIKIPEFIKSVEFFLSTAFGKDLNEHAPIYSENVFACLPSTLENLIIRNELRYHFKSYILNWNHLPKPLRELTFENIELNPDIQMIPLTIKKITLINTWNHFAYEPMFDDISKLISEMNSMHQHYTQLEEYNMTYLGNILYVKFNNKEVETIIINGVKN